MDARVCYSLTCLCFVLLFCGRQCLKLETLARAVSQTLHKPVTKCDVGYDIRVLAGSRWTEGCRTCRCDPDIGKMCEGPVCPNPYHPSHADHCIQWSADKCCCERVGCLNYGKAYNFGEVFPKTPDSCEECLCEGGPGPQKCWTKHCHLQCVDAKQIPGFCCKQCVNGENCSLPPMQGVDESINAGVKSPLAVNDTRLIYSNTIPGLFYLCACVIPGAASVCFQNMQL